MHVKQLIKFIEDIAPPGAAAPWDASGVQVASFRERLSKVAVMLDPRQSFIEKALADGADFILAHHPLSMQPVFPNQADDYLRVLGLLLKADVCLYSLHTPLDASPAGTAQWLAGEMGLADLRVLEPTEGSLPEYACHDLPFGFGFSGTLQVPLPYREFCRRLGAIVHKEAWTVCGPRPETVSVVACCPGSGSSMMLEAFKRQADVFITGDVKYHTALQAEDMGLHIIDVGHFALEEEMMARMARILEDELPIPVQFYPGKDPLSVEQAV